MAHKNPSGGPDAFIHLPDMSHLALELGQYHVRKCGIRYFIKPFLHFTHLALLARVCHWSGVASAKSS